MIYVTSAVHIHFNVTVTSHRLFIVDTVMQYSAETYMYIHSWTHYIWMLAILVIIMKTWHVQRMSNIFRVCRVCLSHVPRGTMYQRTVPAVNLLVSKAPSLPYVLPLRCFFYSLDKPTVEPAKDKHY